MLSQTQKTSKSKSVVVVKILITKLTNLAYITEIEYWNQKLWNIKLFSRAQNLLIKQLPNAHTHMLGIIASSNKVLK